MRILRVLQLIGVFFRISWRWYATVQWKGHAGSIQHRAVWMKESAQALADSLRLRVRFSGTPPDQGLIVSNHLSYLDILVLGVARPTIFVSKYEVRSWPWLGWLTNCAGTLYINREQRKDVARLKESIEQRLADGLPIAFFPEGTSTGGDAMLPFRPSLLEPASATQCQVTPACIAYHLPGGGSVMDEVCYWRDMTFGPHLWNLLGKSSIEASVIYGTPRAADPDRKVLAKALQLEVEALRHQQPWPVPAKVSSLS